MSCLCRIFATFSPLNKTWNLNYIVSFSNQYRLFYVRLTCICFGKPGSAVTRIDLMSEMTKSRMIRQYLFYSTLTQTIKRSIYVSFLYYISLNQGIQFLLNIPLNNVIFLGKYGHIIFCRNSGGEMNPICGRELKKMATLKRGLDYQSRLWMRVSTWSTKLFGKHNCRPHCTD